MPRTRDETGRAGFGLLLAVLLALSGAATINVARITSLFGGDAGDLTSSGPGAMRDRTKQSGAMAEMNAIGKANIAHLLRTGRYAASLRELAGNPRTFSDTDPWGTAWIYRAEGKNFVLASLGSDGARGPEPPERWGDDDFAPDLILRNGEFIQAPQLSRRLLGTAGQ